jgi:hypothetical protein
LNEVLVIEQIFGWLTRQSDRVGSTIPLFSFQAFDDPVQSQFGLYRLSPYGLKPPMMIPSWTNKAIDAASSSRSPGQRPLPRSGLFILAAAFAVQLGRRVVFDL